MDQLYKWFDKKQAGCRKLPLSDRNPRINFRRNRVFRQATVPSGYRPCHVYHTSTFPRESLLRVPGLLLLPSKHLLLHHMIAKWFAIKTPRVSSCFLSNHLYRRSLCVNNQHWLFTHRDQLYKWFDSMTGFVRATGLVRCVVIGKPQRAHLLSFS